jgi:hypothetical protein
VPLSVVDDPQQVADAAGADKLADATGKLDGLAERVSSTTGLEVELEVDLSYESGRASERHSAAVESAPGDGSTIHTILLATARGSTDAHGGRARMTAPATRHTLGA